MLNARLKLILGELIGAESPLTSAYLANELNVTSRTIRSDVKELDRLFLQKRRCRPIDPGAGYGFHQDDRLFQPTSAAHNFIKSFLLPFFSK